MYCPDQYLHIPGLDLLSWTFEHADKILDKQLSYLSAMLEPAFNNQQVYVNAYEPSESLTVRDVKSYVRRLVGGLRARSIGLGDTVCVLSYNNILYSALYLGIIGSGACFVGANPAYTFLELRHLLLVSKVKLLVVDVDLLVNLLPAAVDCGIPLSSILIFGRAEPLHSQGLQSWTVLLQNGEHEWLSFDDEEKAKSSTATLMLTSGTTGLPKTAALSHYAHVAQSVLLYDSKDKPYEVKRLVSLPQFHAFAAPLVHLAPVREGHRTYIMGRYQKDQYLRFIDLYGITETAVVPPMVFDLLTVPNETKLLSTLRYVWCAGAPLSGEAQRRMIDMLDPTAIFSQVWGMSEVGWITTFHFPESDTSGSVGRLLPNMEAKLVNECGDDILEDDRTGEVLVRGPSVMTGYLGDRKATEASFVDGWLKTGDIGHCKSGKWYIIDRAKELIKVRGWQISPTELEACLLMHPAIIDAAVIGVEYCEQSGELPRAYVVLNKSFRHSVSELDIQGYFHGYLAKYKALTGGVRIVGSIPKSSSGKVLRKVLKEVAACEIAREIDSNRAES